MHKKALTATLLAGICVAAFSAKAEDSSNGPTVKINGVFRSYATVISPKVRSTKAAQFSTYGNFTFHAGGMTNNGLSYGALGVFQLDRAKSNTDKLSEAYLYLSSDAIGNFQFGDTHGVESLMMYDGTDVMGGTGGFDSNLDKTLNITRGVNFSQNVGQPNNGYNRATKINWMSPEVSGFQVGFSYAPTTEQHGRSYNTRALDANGNPTKGGDRPYAANYLGSAVSYTEEFGAYTVGVYLAGVTAKTKGPRGTADQGADLHPVRAWHLGTLIDYQSWQFGGALFDNGRSYMRRNTHFTNTRGYNMAVGYGVGPASLALGYTGTERKVTQGKAKADIASFTVDYSLADGIAVYGEASYFKFRAPAAHIRDRGAATDANPGGFNASTDFLDRMPSSNTNNQGSAFVLGTRVMF